ncbi:MAG: response regulator transcription factor [Bifidobacteriaceae bacterium]|nr:response regulator transcription factor [Bifidobacteriaceae bacterium]
MIVDDHDMFRAGLKAMLDAEVFEVVGEADSVETAITCIKSAVPDAVLLDVHLLTGKGADVIIGTNGMDKQPNFLALSVSDSPEDVVSTIRAGASGYITKTASVEEINRALQQAAEGYAVFSPKLAGFVLSGFHSALDGKVSDSISITGFAKSDARAQDVSDENYNSLTRREREVLRYIARGYTYKEIAKELFVSVKTVESHVSSVLRKLQLTNRNDITSYAYRRGVV